VRLTDSGKALHAACREVFEALARYESDVADLKGLKQGHLRLAVVTTAKYFAPILLGQFCEKYPGIDVSLKVTNRERLLERMADRADDFYIMGEPPQVREAVFEPFTPNPLVVVAWPKHPLVNEKRIALAALAKEQFIMREPGSGTRLAILNYLHGHNVTPQIRMELGSNEAIKQAVMGKLGISILSRHAVGADLRARRLRILDVRGFPIPWNWYIGYRAQRQQSVLAKTFLEFLRKDGRRILAEVSA
jgi:DNA-binding transcriptional LysR family regulator